MQFITNRISTGKTKTFEDFVNEYKASKVKTASVEEVAVKTAEQDEADSSGQLDVEPLHQTGESTTMPKAGPSAKKEGESEGSEAPKVAKDKDEDEADSSGQPEAEGKLVNDPKVLDEKKAEAEVKEAGEKGMCDCGKPNFICKGKCKGDSDDGKDRKDPDDKEASVKEADVKKEDEEKEEKEADVKKEDEEKEEKEEKEATSEIKFVKVANLDSKNKGFLKKYWAKLYGEPYADAMVSDK